jgi:hypothetical protein
MKVENWILIRIKVKKDEALEAHFEALEGPNLGKSKW